jgi:hypothetical protein
MIGKRGAMESIMLEREAWTDGWAKEIYDQLPKDYPTKEKAMSKDNTMKALDGSIEKWEGIVMGTELDRGRRNCPLCQEFGAGGGCGACPIAADTEDSGCRNTPYTAWSSGGQLPRKADTPEKIKAAIAMLDYLKDLKKRLEEKAKVAKPEPPAMGVSPDKLRVGDYFTILRWKKGTSSLGGWGNCDQSWTDGSIIEVKGIKPLMVCIPGGPYYTRSPFRIDGERIESIVILKGIDVLQTEEHKAAVAVVKAVRANRWVTTGTGTQICGFCGGTKGVASSHATHCDVCRALKAYKAAIK